MENQNDARASAQRYDAVLFDLLTALINSWTVWNDVAGSDEDGLKWRKEYLKLTYGAGEYRPYERIVAEAAEAAGLSAKLADTLVDRRRDLRLWPEAGSILEQLKSRRAADAPLKLGVVTNCSDQLGLAIAEQVFEGFDVVVTAERAGFYKPRPEPYRLALKELGAAPERTLFVAGSSADVPGASGVGMPVYWHNRIGLTAVDAVKPDHLERSLDPLVQLV